MLLLHMFSSHTFLPSRRFFFLTGAFSDSPVSVVDSIDAPLFWGKILCQVGELDRFAKEFSKYENGARLVGEGS